MGYADRIIVPFFDDELEDLVLLVCLSRLTRKRNRGNKIKELVVESLKQNNSKLFTDALNDIKNFGIDEALKQNVSDILFSNPSKLSKPNIFNDTHNDKKSASLQEENDIEAEIGKQFEENGVV